MMSIAKVGTAVGAARYYTRDNYYTGGEQAAESTWAGAGAARLGLSPKSADVVDVYRTPQPVEARAFEAVLDGRPSESVQIGHRDRDGTWQHQPGFDLTFLAPKSVSILALVGGDRRLIEAHRAAVAETMAFVEERLIGVQENPKGGPKTMRPTQSGVFALFTHDLSRAHDALLHTHAVVANATWDPLKDRWRAIDGQALYDNRRLISNVFDARLRARTEALGYRTEMSGRYGAWEVPIGDAVIRLQSKRRQAILDRLGKAAGTADWNTRQEVARATRDAKRTPDRTALQATHESELKAVGFDARAYVADARRLLPQKRSRTSRVRRGRPETLEAATERHIRHALHTRTTVTPGQILLSMSMDGNVRFDPDAIEAELASRLRSGALLAHSIGRDGQLRMTTPDMVARETRLLDFLETSGRTAPLVSDRDGLAALVSRLPERTTNDGQRALVERLLSGPSRYHGVQGHAGTGKTSTLRKLIAVGIRAGAGPDLRERLHALAPTHKALAQLKSATGATGSVTQQFVADYRHLLAEGAKASESEWADWSDRVVVLDEASQVSYAHGEELMRVFDALRPRKIVLMGDRDQTNSVAAGNWFELLQDRGLPTDTLREVVRQKGVEAVSPELLRSAQKVANGDTLGALYALSDRIREAPKQPSGSAKDGTPIEPTSGPGGDTPVEPSDYVALAAQAALESDRAGRDYILYAPTNSLRQALNENFRAARREAGDLGADTTLTALKPLYTSPAFMGAASSYRRGDVLHFGRSVARGTYEKDSLWTVITVNPERNILTLVPQGTPEADLKCAKRHWRLQPMEQFPFTHLSGRDVSVAVGDEIAFGLRDAALRIGRGQQAVVTAITDRSVTLSRPETAEDRDAERRAAFSEAEWIRVEGGKAGPVLELTLPRDHVQVQSLQHAYAFTTYTVQGQSRDQAIVAMHAQSDAVNRKSVGVSITREERDLQIYTNDVRALHRNAVRTDDAALPVTGLDPDRFGGLDPLTAGSFADQSRAFAEARATRSVSADGSPEDRDRDAASLFDDGLEPLSWDDGPTESQEALAEARNAFDPDVWDGFGFGDETDIGVHQREVDDREADHAVPASHEAELDDRAGHDVGASR